MEENEKVEITQRVLFCKEQMGFFSLQSSSSRSFCVSRHPLSVFYQSNLTNVVFTDVIQDCGITFFSCPDHISDFFFFFCKYESFWGEHFVSMSKVSQLADWQVQIKKKQRHGMAFQK